MRSNDQLPFLEFVSRLNLFFPGLNSKKRIECASKVRSYNGLMVHVFGKLVAALYFWNFVRAFQLLIRIKEVFNISINLASWLQELSQQQSSSDNPRAEKIEDNYSKTLPKEARFLSLGLKNLVRRENGIIKFCINHYRKISGQLSPRRKILSGHFMLNFLLKV